jgi:hypothetical protein
MSRWMALSAVALALSPASGAARQPTLGGAWHRLPDAPAAAAIPYERVGVWTGRQLLVFGRTGAPGAMRNVAFAFDPAAHRWRTLSPPAGDTGSYEGALGAVWTGRQMLVWGPAVALSYEPATNVWRQLPPGPLRGAPSGLVVWTGREMVTWGGGCCGDVTNDGAAYDPSTRTWRKLPRAPVGGQQRPAGAWTGRELIVLPGRDPEGRRTGGAAYDFATKTWRTIAAPPQERLGATAVWDGRKLLVVGGSAPPAESGIRKLVSVPYAYNPDTNRWRTLRSMDGGAYGRDSAAAVWTGKRLLLWGGETQARGRYVLAPHGLAYDPVTDRWSQLAGAPLLGRMNPVAAWTGSSLLVWGGDAIREDVPISEDWWPFLDGGSFTPAMELAA